jgi:hypothetical protein
MIADNNGADAKEGFQLSLFKHRESEAIYSLDKIRNSTEELQWKQDRYLEQKNKIKRKKKIKNKKELF